MSGGKVNGGENGVSINRGGTHTFSGGEITSDMMGLPIYGYHKVDSDGNIQEEPYGKTVLTVSGGTIIGYYHGISGNGKFDANTFSRGSTIINILDGAKIHGTTGDGIYHPQLGELTISGGTITGASGVEMRAGTLNMIGGTVTGLADEFTAGPNGDGNTVTGAGVIVSQHREHQKIDVDISDGAITGYVSFYEDAFQGSSPEDLAKVHIRISGGKFASVGESAAFAKHNDSIVIGGMFSQPVGKYTDNGGNVIEELGSLTAEEMRNVHSTLPNPDGKVFCVKVENSTLPYHVGYLTGVGYDITLEEGSESDQLLPTYSLNGKLVKGDDGAKGKIINAVFVNVDRVNHIHDRKEDLAVQTWTSGDEDVATVDGDGVVTAVKAGSAAITATLLNGETVPFTVTVVTKQTPFEPEAAYKVEHYRERLGGGYVLADTQRLSGKIGDTVTAVPNQYDHYTLDNAASVTSGVVSLPADGGDGNPPVILTLRLFYKLDTLTVTYDLDGGTWNGGNTDTVKYGDTLMEPENPTRAGYIFKGWYTDEGKTAVYDFNTPVTTDLTLYAKWVRNSVTPTAPTNPGKPTKPAGSTPQTGDNSNVFLWMVLLVISCGGLAGTLACKKRRIMK